MIVIQIKRGFYTFFQKKIVREKVREHSSKQRQAKQRSENTTSVKLQESKHEELTCAISKEVKKTIHLKEKCNIQLITHVVGLYFKDQKGSMKNCSPVYTFVCSAFISSN